MRKAAGILMIIFGMTTVGIYFGFVTDYVAPASYLAATLFTILPVAPIVIGGVFCLKRKYWKLCFASSLFLLVFMILFLLSLPLALHRFLWVTCLFIPMGILPQIFICLRKREWQEQEFQG